MPSRQPQSTAPPRAPPVKHQRYGPSPLVPLIAGGVAAISFLVVLAILYRRLSRTKTTPLDPKPQRFSYSLLRRATCSFSPSNKLGQGGFGCVYRGTLVSGQQIAVKLMDSDSLQGEREFQNELLLAGKIDSDRVVSLLGYCSAPRGHRLLLVYEFMQNRSLQDALFHRKCPELMVWKTRYGIASDIARGLEFLHRKCDPPIIHGDIKPSNILLDDNFSAKIADFGLARLKTEVETEMPAKIGPNKKKKRRKKNEKDFRMNGHNENGGSIVEENEGITTVDERSAGGGGVASESPENSVSISFRSPETDAALEVFCSLDASETVEKTSVSDLCYDKVSIDSSSKDFAGNKKGNGKKSISGRDWWWKQDNGSSDSGGVKDYVMEWIGTEIKKERPKSDWIAGEGQPAGKPDQKKQRRQRDWWASWGEDRIGKKEKNKQGREWWREEFCEELSKKKRKGGKLEGQWWDPPESSCESRRKKKSRSRSSMDWSIDGLGGDLRIGRSSRRDWASGEIPKSSGASSTPSMRGTLCYIAPEYSGGGFLSEKSDIYSFGVLLLVLVSGRRPLQVTASPMADFERANLMSWARHLAHTGKLLDLVDPALGYFDREQALLCITVALLCLQRLPTHRPTIAEVVRMLSGETEPPHLPFEFSPLSPSAGFPFKYRKKPSSEQLVQKEDQYQQQDDSDP